MISLAPGQSEAAKTLKKSVEDSLRTGPIVKNQNDATGAQFF